MTISQPLAKRYKASIALIRKTFGDNKRHEEWLNTLLGECEAALAYKWDKESHFENRHNDDEDIQPWRRAIKLADVEAVKTATLIIAEFLEATPVQNGPAVFEALEQAGFRLIPETVLLQPTAQAEWQASSALRAEFEDKFDNFLAFRKAEARGLLVFDKGFGALDEPGRNIKKEITDIDFRRTNAANMLASTLRYLADDGFWKPNSKSRPRYIFGPLEYAEPIDTRSSRPQQDAVHLYYLINLLNELTGKHHYEIAKQMTEDTFESIISEKHKSLDAQLEAIESRYFKYKRENPDLAFNGYERPVKTSPVYLKQHATNNEPD